MRRRRCLLALVAITGTLLLGGKLAQAHKPITSRYTYNEDVFPVLRDRCGRCHVEGGVAPMSLLTHADAISWAESIRAELLAGHMPPWKVDGPPEKFRNASPLTPRELDMLLTWVTGGTPIGDVEKTPSPVAQTRTWPLGNPDLILELPTVALPASQRDDIKEFTVRVPTKEPRSLRAVDLLPGTAAIVRSATISVRADSSDTSSGIDERVLGLWQPGDDPVALDGGMAFRIPAAAALTVRVHYRKLWRDERRAISDQSKIGLYFVSGPSSEVRPLTLALTGDSNPIRTEQSRQTDSVSFTQIVDDDVRGLAIHPASTLPRAQVRVTAAKPDGSRLDVIAFRSRPEWARRYWFTQPIDLPRGTVLEVTAQPDNALLAPDAPRIPQAPLDPFAIRLTLDLVSTVKP